MNGEEGWNEIERVLHCSWRESVNCKHLGTDRFVNYKKGKIDQEQQTAFCFCDYDKWESCEWRAVNIYWRNSNKSELFFECAEDEPPALIVSACFYWR